MSSHNHWDKTIWDPVNPEHAIEDPMHGPSAVHDMLQTPPMPIGDGTYYQPGAFYTQGTSFVDSHDKPIFKIGKIGMDGLRSALELQEWVAAYDEGEEALIALEASRQQERLKETGFAHCFKLSDVCPGGKRLGDCAIGNTAYQAAQDWAVKNEAEKPGEGVVSNVLVSEGRKCESCSVACEVSVKTQDGKPTESRVTFYKPDTDVRVVPAELQSLDPTDDRISLENLGKAMEELHNYKPVA